MQRARERRRRRMAGGVAVLAGVLMAALSPPAAPWWERWIPRWLRPEWRAPMQIGPTAIETGSFG